MKTDKADALRDALVSRARTLGLTAYEVARLSGLDPGVVKRYFSGRRAAMSPSVSAMADALSMQLMVHTSEAPLHEARDEWNTRAESQSLS